MRMYQASLQSQLSEPESSLGGSPENTWHQGSCSQAGLKLSVTQGWPCITDPGAGITGVSHRAWFMQCWGPRPGPRASCIRTLPIELHAPQFRARLLFFSSLSARCVEGEGGSPDEEAAVRQGIFSTGGDRPALFGVVSHRDQMHLCACSSEVPITIPRSGSSNWVCALISRHHALQRVYHLHGGRQLYVHGQFWGQNFRHGNF